MHARQSTFAKHKPRNLIMPNCFERENKGEVNENCVRIGA